MSIRRLPVASAMTVGFYSSILCYGNSCFDLSLNRRFTQRAIRVKRG